MSVTINEISPRKCNGCGDEIERVHVDLFDCGGTGLILKQDDDWVELDEQMVTDLVNILWAWQNRFF